jgi:hypothetical protein
MLSVLHRNYQSEKNLPDLDFGQSSILLSLNSTPAAANIRRPMN